MKRYFIPHEANDYKPQLLRPRAVAFVCLVALVVEAVFLFGSSFVAPRSKLFGIIVANALVDGTNQARVADNLSPLQENALLDVAAQDKANDMVANNYFAHTSPSGLTPWYWFEQAGYNFSVAGENLAVNFADSSDVTNAWLNSPEHRANILNAGFTDIGMATAQGEYQGQPAIYVVELFGTPAPTFGLSPFAEAATPPVAAAPTAATTSIATAVVPATSTKPTPKQVAATIVTASPTFIEVRAETSTATGTAVNAASGIPASTTAGTVGAPTVKDQANIVQQAASDPREVVDYFFFALAALFAVALLLNVFIKIHIQHPQLILGGMLVVIIAGLFIVLNQHFALTNIAIL